MIGIESDIKFVEQGMDYILKNKDNKSGLWHVEFEEITREPGLLRLDHVPLLYIAKMLIYTNNIGEDLFNILKWVIETQNEDGSWQFTDPVTNHKMRPRTWITISYIRLLFLAERAICNNARQILLSHVIRRRMPAPPTEICERIMEMVGIDDYNDIVPLGRKPKTKLFISKTLGIYITILTFVMLLTCIAIMCHKLICGNISSFVFKVTTTLSIYLWAMWLLYFGRKGGIKTFNEMSPSEFAAIVIAVALGVPGVIGFLVP